MSLGNRRIGRKFWDYIGRIFTSRGNQSTERSERRQLIGKDELAKMRSSVVRKSGYLDLLNIM